MNRLILLTILCLLVQTGLAQNYRIDTVIGLGNKVGDGEMALQALLRSPAGIALDREGRLVIADKQHHRIRRIALDGRISTIAGTGVRGVRGDDGLAVEAELWEPSGVAIDSKGTILVADGSSRIHAITSDGRINTVAGNGRNGFSGDGGKATEASIGIPGGIAVDPVGNFYFSEVLQARVRRVSAEGVISTVAGNGTGGFTGDGGPATAASLLIPLGLAISPTNTLLIADFGNLRIREVLTNSTIRTIAGGGQGGDGGDATAAFVGNPCAVAIDSNRNIYVGESGSRVRRVGPNGRITTVASSETAQAGQPAPVRFSADAGPCGLTIDNNSGLFVSQGGIDAVTRIQLDQNPWTARTIAGRLGTALSALPPRELPLFLPQGLEIAADQSLLFTDAEAQRIYRSDQGSLSVFAGIGRPGFSGDAGPALNAAFTAPIAITGGTGGKFWIADSLNRRIRLVGPDGKISTVASGEASNPANRLGVPLDLLAAPDGTVYFTEVGRHTVRRLDSNGNLSIVAGGEQAGFSGDGGPATGSLLDNPIGLAIDPAGNIYIADSANQAVRRINVSGRIDTVAGRGPASEWVGLPATQARLTNPSRLAVDATGALLIAETTSDGKAGSIRRLDAEGLLTPIAGNRLGGEAGEGALALRASLGPIGALRGASDGSVWFTDTANRAIRRLTPLRPASLRVAGGDKQTGLAGRSLPEPLAVMVVDEAGIALPRIAIRFRVASGSALLAQDLVQTDDSGIALAILNAGAEAGPIEIEAELADSTTSAEPVRFQLQSLASVDSPVSTAPVFRVATTAGTAKTAMQESVFLADPVGFASDPLGNYYISDEVLNRILKVAPDGNCQIVAGISESDFCRQSQSSPQAIQGPAGLLITPAGDLYFVERTGNRVRKLSATGELSIFAGTGQPGFAGDNGPATSARLNLPFALALAADGGILISDTGNRRLRKVDSTGRIETFAGSGIPGAGGAGAPALQAPFVSPMGLSFGPDGVLYVADAGAHQVKGISTEGVVFIVAGTGRPPVVAQRQTGAIPEELDTPQSVAVSSIGAIYIGELGRVRVLAPGVAPAAIPDRGLGQRLLLAYSEDKLYLLDSDRASLSLIDSDSSLRVLVGSRFYGDGGQAVDATLSSVEGLAYSADGILYVSDTQNNRIRRILPGGVIETFAGNGRAATSGDGGPALEAGIDGPAGLAVHPDGSLLVAESRGARIRRISPDGIISTFAGSGLLGNTGDDGFAREASFQSPTGLAFDSSGNLFVSDFLANTVRRISPDGIIRRYVGTARLNSENMNPAIGLRAVETDLQGPSGLAVDKADNLLVVDKLNNRVWKILPSGAITIFAGSGQRRAGGEGLPAMDAPFNRPSAIAVDSQGRAFVSEEANRIRVIQPDGLVFTAAGRGPAGMSGDNGLAPQASLNDPGPIAIGPDGTIVFSDRGNRRLRRLIQP